MRKLTRHFFLSFHLLFVILLCSSAAHAAMPLTVTSMQPQGEMQNLTQIVVRFSENMRALGQMEQDAATSPLILTPSAGSLPKGQFRWIDPATLAYLFDEPVNAPVTLTATVRAGTRALSGNTLAETVTWQTATPAARLSVYPTANLPPKNAQLTLTSNYPLDIESLKAHTTLTMNGAVPLPIDITPASQYPASAFGGRRSSWRYTIIIRPDLPPDAYAVLNMAPGITCETVGAPLPGQTFNLATHERLKILSWHDRYARDKEKTVMPEAPVALRFNNPVKLSDLLAHLEISPQPPRKLETGRDEDTLVSAYQTLPFAWEARTSYTITLKAGLADSYGFTLADDATHRFTTGDFQPLLYMQTGNHLMEKPLAGIFPIDIRNLSPVTIHVRHHLWNHGTLSAWYNNLQRDKRLTTLPAVANGTQTLDFSADFNKNIRYNLDIPKTLGYASADAMPPGLTEIYVTTADPNARNDEGEARQKIYYATTQMTNIALTAKTGVREGLAWVTDLTTGKPLADVPLILTNDKGQTVWTGKSGADGIAQLPGYGHAAANPRYLIAQQGSDTSVLPLQSTTLYGGAHNNYETLRRGYYWNIFALTQLPLYQPGQTVQYTVYAKTLAEDKGINGVPDWSAWAGKKVKLIVRDSRRREIHVQEATTNAYGSISGSFTLPAEAATGQYQFHLTADGSHLNSSITPFTVAVFRAPDFKVDLDAFADIPNPPARAKPIPIGMKAAYFSGVALPGAKAVMNVTKTDERFTPMRLAGYKTGIRSDCLIPVWHGAPGRRSMPMRGSCYAWQKSEAVGSIDVTTDSKGLATFLLPDIVAPAGQPVRVGMEATVTDKSGLTSQGSHSFLLHPSSYYVGLRAKRFMLAGQQSNLDIRAAMWDNKPLSGVDITLRAEKLPVQRGESDTAKNELLWEKTVPLAKESGTALPLSFEKSGTYQLTAVITDEMGRKNETQLTILVPGGEMDWASSGTSKTLEILSEEQEYTPGEKARLVIKNPFYRPASKGMKADEGKTTALVTIERDSIRRHFFMEVAGPTAPLDIPITAEDAPYTYVSVVMLRGRTAAPPGLDAIEIRDIGAPGVYQGTKLLKVKTTPKVLNVKITTDAKNYRPGKTVAAFLSVTDAAKRPQQVQVTLLAVDNRVLRAAGEKTQYDPSRAFGEIPIYGINSADSRVFLLDLGQISPKMLGGGMNQRMMMAESAAAPAPKVAADLRHEKGAGGDDASPEVRSNFSPMAYWLATGQTDAKGRLKTRFTLPDTLTSYRIVAVVADKAKTFGVADTEITATKPLQLLSALPRFTTEGDKLAARILVQNTSKKAQTVTITASGDNLTLREAQRKITLGAGKSGAVTFLATIGTPGNATLKVNGKAGKETDAAAFSFPVMPAAPLTTVAAAGLLKPGEPHALLVNPPAQLDKRSKLSVILAPSPAAGMPLAAEQLIAYPWGCLEQRMSRAWLRAIRLENGELIGMKPDARDREIIQATLNSVEKFQKSDGGFSIWPGMSSSSFYLTVYALTVNSETKRQGMTMPADVERRAWQYVHSRMAESYSDRKEERSNNPLNAEAMAVALMAKNDAREAQQLYPKVLARAGDGKNVNPMTWAALLMAGNELQQQAQRAQYTPAIALEKNAQIAHILTTLEKTAQVTPTHLHFAANNQSGYWMTMGSTLRDNGFVLGALTRTKPDYPRLEALAAWISQGLGDKKTLSTQEAIYGLWGLTGYLKHLGGNQPVSVTATWNQRESVTKNFTRLIDPPRTWTLPADKLNGGNTTQLAFTAKQGRPYWTARLTYASPLVPVRDENAGLIVKRSWAKSGEKTGSANKGNAWKMGDIIDVTVTLTVPATRRHVLLFDPFPAGLEPLHASRVDLENAAKRYQHPWQWEETRNDGMLLYSESIHPGTYTYTYQLRAAAPGTFAQRPSYAEEMYTPEVFGRTAGQTITIGE